MQCQHNFEKAVSIYHTRKFAERCEMFNADLLEEI